MKTNDFERLLRDAALQAEETMVSDFTANDTAHSFSPAFEVKMDTLLRSNRSAASFTRVLKSAACIALVLLMGGTLWLGTDAEARERFIGWLKNIESPTTVHYYFDGVDDTAPVRYEMTKIPDGYTFVEEYDMLGGSYTQLYRNEMGQQFAFGVYQSEDSNIFIGNYDAVKTVSVHGIPADYYYHPDGSDRNILLWIIPETKVLIYVQGFQNEAELVEIAESVVAVLSLSTDQQ